MAAAMKKVTRRALVIAILELLYYRVTLTAFVNVVYTDPTAYLEVGTRAELPCLLEFQVNTVSWLKQASQQEPELIIISGVVSNHPGLKEGPGYASGGFDIDDNFSLVIKDVKIRDGGKYICEVSDIQADVFRRNETIVSIFRSPVGPYPVIKECIIQDEGACLLNDSTETITCFVEGFYPNITLIILDEMHSPLNVISNAFSCDNGSTFKSITANISTSSLEFYCVALDIPGESGNRTKRAFFQLISASTEPKADPIKTVVAALMVVFMILLVITFMSYLCLWRRRKRCERSKHDVEEQTSRGTHENNEEKNYILSSEEGQSRGSVMRNNAELQDYDMRSRVNKLKEEIEKLTSKQRQLMEDIKEMRNREDRQMEVIDDMRRKEERQKEENDDMRRREERQEEKIEEMRRREERQDEIKTLKSRTEKLMDGNSTIIKRQNELKDPIKGGNKNNLMKNTDEQQNMIHIIKKNKKKS